MYIKKLPLSSQSSLYSEMKSVRKSFLMCLFILTSCLLLNGCSSHTQDNKTADNSPDNYANIQSSGQESDGQDFTALDSERPTFETKPGQSDSRPDKLTVLSVRKTALEGMKPEDIERLNTDVAAANLALERYLIFGDLQDHLSDPEDSTWNYLHQTGEIIIGYSFESDIWEQRESLGLSRQEFEQQYGQPVYAHNDYDADRILVVLDELKESIQNEKFKQNFVTMSELVQNAEKTHDIKYIINIYRILHDMDYYVLRYGPQDVGKYVQDKSTIQKYYGVLEDYIGTPYCNTDGFLQ